MGNKLLYYLVYGWAKVHAWLPMRWLYLLSDLFYGLIYYVVRYRVKVVRRNLQASFPEKSRQELRQLERAFYHHFADYIVETVKLAHISLEELLQRAWIKNPELVDRLQDEGHPVIVMLMGHYGNWEWFTGSAHRFAQTSVYQIYRPLNNKAFDDLFIRLRTQFGSFGIKKNDTVRDVIRLKQRQERSLVIFIADQTPSRNNLHYWTDFLHQDTPFLTGAERIARKLDLPVLFLDVQQKLRGYYTVEFHLLTEHAKETPENWITEEYARRMEQSILRAPENWLWTHKRWKYTRNDIPQKA
ncbi:MAG: lysophospholipid acyltransferase family protein [Parabacteroides sp.]